MTPTVDDILESTSIGNGFHFWHVEGGVLEFKTETLRPVFELAYDPGMPNWVALITFDQESGFHVA
jgi:hypothetical protein